MEPSFWVTHPKAKHPLIDEVDRDFCFLLNAYDIDPGSYTPKIMTMLDFNLWPWNSRIFPGIDSLNVRLGDKVRIRVGNLTMTNHPMHLHGHEFLVTETDGGPVSKSARWPEVITDVAVGQMRQFEFHARRAVDAARANAGQGNRSAGVQARRPCRTLTYINTEKYC